MTKLLTPHKSIFGLILVLLPFVLISFPQKAFGGTPHRQIQRVTFSARDIPLKDVFTAIHNQTGLLVSNNLQETNLSEDRKLTVNFSQTDIYEVMGFLLHEKKDLKFLISGKYIVIYKNSATTKTWGANSNTEDTSIVQYPINGRVTDISGNSIPGATIKVKNGKIGTIANSDGFFRLQHISKGQTIIISSLGYESSEIEVKNKNVIASLKSNTSKLDEKVILAYGNTTKRFNTGNIGSIKALDIEKQPVNNPLLALEGRVAGVFIEQASGLPGTGITINIQGRNSIINGNDPFFVIDGVPYISQLLQPPSSGITAGISGKTGNPLNFINLADIESIEILKDADATAIYGSRAANGAVLITTKKGKPGSMKVDLNLQGGWGEVSHKLKVLNAKDYLEMRHEAQKNDGITTPSRVDYDLNGVWDTTQTKDWQNELIGGSAQYRDVQLSISGGTELTQYLISGGYHKETTVFPGDYSDVKASTRFNIRSASLDQKFRIQLSGSYMKDNNKLPNTDLTSIAIQLSPVAPTPLNSDGTLNWQPNPSGATSFNANPFSHIKRKTTNKTDNLTSQASLSYDIMPWLTMKTSLGYNNLKSNEVAIAPLSALSPESQRFAQRSTNFTSSNMSSWVIEPGIELNKSILDGKLNIYVGGTIQNTNSSRQGITASGFNNDLVIEDIKSAPILQAFQSINTIYKYCALYARVNYNWMDKYILNLTARRDGSSRFGPNNQFHNFGGIGAAWIFSETNFIKQSIPILSFGKLRASYGTTGSDQIPDYQFLDLYETLPAEVPYQQNSLGLAPIRLTTPDLQWEETKKFQIGLELGILNDKILTNINYNRNRSSNQLTGVSLPYITGFPFISRNFNAVVQNTGWEFTVISTNIKTKNFTWSTNINLTIPKNKLVSYARSTNVFYVIDQSISAQPVYKLSGINDSTGLLEFIDEKGVVTDIPSGTSTYINVDPSFYGGLQNSFTYKGISLDIFLQFVKRTGQDLTYGYNSSPGNFSSGLGNKPVTVLDRWQKNGDQASQPKFTSSFSGNIPLQYARGSDAAYSDASYIRLKNVSLSWQLPPNWLKNLRIRSVRLYTQGQNLFTITNYFGLDPESRGMGMPPLREIVFGAQIAF